MLISDMHYELKVALDKINSSVYPYLSPEEVDYFLNEAIHRFVKLRYREFELTQKRIDDLSKLVTTCWCTTSVVTDIENTYQASIGQMFSNESRSVQSTAKYMFYLNGNSKNSNSKCSGKYRAVKVVQHDDLSKTLIDPFKRPSILEAIIYHENGNIYIVTDGTFIIENFRLTFLREPLKVQYGTVYPTPTTDVNCELADHTHKEIVQLAVAIILENIEAQRQATNNGQPLIQQGMISTIE